MVIKYLTIVVMLCCAMVIHGQTAVSLKDAFTLARTNNPYFKAEKLNSGMAASDLKTANLAINPTFGVGYSQISSSRYLAENTAFFGSSNRQVSYQIGKAFQVKGQRKLRIEQATNDFKLSQENLNEFERNLLNDVATKWLDLWFATQKLSILKLAKENADTLMKISELRLKNQVITTTEFLRTRILSDQYNLLLINAKQDLMSQQNELKFVLGKQDSLMVNEQNAALILPLTDRYDTLLAYAMKNRSDLIISNQLEEKAKTEIILQKAMAYPQPEMGLNYSTQNQVPYAGAFISVAIPAFNRNQGEIDKSKISLSQTQYLQNATIVKVNSELAIAYSEYHTNKNTFEKYKEIFSKSEIVLKTVRFSYLKGGTTIIDYLEAERNWFELQSQYFEAYYNYKKSVIQLLFVSNLIQTI